MSQKIYIYPTDTVWGIGGDAFKEETYLKISQIKQTDITKPLSVLFDSTEMLGDYVELPPKLLEIIEDLKHLEITFGVEKKYFHKSLPEIPFQSTDFICVRVLGSEIIKNIIQEVNSPITTTSLNITGESPIVTEKAAKDFWRKFAPNELLVSSSVGEEVTGNSSTIIILSGNEYKILRSGNRVKEIEEILEERFSRHG